MKRTIAIAALFALLAGGSSAQVKTADPTVFGLRLGDKFSLPECARSAYSDSTVVVYEETDSSPCFQLNPLDRTPAPPNTPILNDQHITIRFPTSSATEMTSDVSAQIIDGNLEGVFIGTWGLETQDKTLTALNKKYGDPVDFQEEKKQNGYGAIFQSYLARWEFPTFTVIFEGSGDRTDSGYIAIETKKEAEFQRALREKTENGPKL